MIMQTMTATVQPPSESAVRRIVTQLPCSRRHVADGRIAPLANLTVARHKGAQHFKFPPAGLCTGRWKKSGEGGGWEAIPFRGGA